MAEKIKNFSDSRRPFLKFGEHIIPLTGTFSEIMGKVEAAIHQSGMGAVDRIWIENPSRHFGFSAHGDFSDPSKLYLNIKDALTRVCDDTTQSGIHLG